MTALAFHSTAVRSLQGNILTITAEEFEQLKKLTVCGRCGGRGTILYGHLMARAEPCPRCGGSGFSVSKRPIIGVATEVECQFCDPTIDRKTTGHFPLPAGALWVADEIEHIEPWDCNDRETGLHVVSSSHHRAVLRGVRRLAKPFTHWFERVSDSAFDEVRFVADDLPLGVSEATVGLVEATKETA